MKRTIEYIQHLIEQLIFGEKLHIVIVDNSECKDGLDLCCAEYGKWECLRLEIQGEFYVFRTNYATIVYCYSGGNLGYAKGNNLGTEVSDKFFSDDYYLISNNDLKISQKINWDYVKNIFETKPNIAAIMRRGTS